MYKRQLLYEEYKFITELSQIKKVIFVGQQLYDYYCDSNIIKKSLIINNCIPSSYKMRTNADTKKVVYSGALIKQKGFHILAKAWKNILKAVPDAELYVLCLLYTSFHGISYDQVEQKCFATIQQEIFKASNVNQVKKYKIAENQVKVNLPVRVNWGGGWTDTPPYCNEKGGVVLNAAILLNGQEPIEVELRKLPENHIEFASLDLDAHGVVTTAAEIQDCHNLVSYTHLHWKNSGCSAGTWRIQGET